jgi:ABC-2 type transport system ATP-binding protein
MAVDDVSLNLYEGEVFGLLGPNGAGKTTLIRIINRIITQEKGTVKYKGELMKGKHLASIGYLPEERGLYKTMTVFDHAMFLGRLRRMSRSEVVTSLTYWLEKFEIENWKNKRIEELSKGMAQKVQFICSVIHNPDLLILDEPFSGFDPVNVELIQTELMEP